MNNDDMPSEQKKLTVSDVEGAVDYEGIMKEFGKQYRAAVAETI